VGAFYNPQENLAVGVSQTRTCRVEGRTCPANLSGNRLGDRICSVQDLVAEELGYVTHVRAESRACLGNASEI
jgi:hypothetical protein